MLQINVSGPGFQNLNIIDTPGFFPLSKLLFSGSAVENLVCSLMRDERNIILYLASILMLGIVLTAPLGQSRVSQIHGKLWSI